MSEHYLKKIDRVTAILTQLQSKPLVRAQDLATKFDVSIRTIYRDIKTLESAGIPIIGEAGNGYSLMEGYKLPPVMFTKEEVLSFITAEKLMHKFSHESLGSHYQTAMDKVKSVLKYSDKNMIQDIEKQIDVYNYAQKEVDVVKNAIPIILESIAEKKQLKLNYQAVNNEVTERIVEAVGIFFEFNFWYMMAFCTLRRDFRQFRMDRMQGIRKLDSDFKTEYGSLADYKKSSQKEKVEVQILVPEKLNAHIVNSKKFYGLTKEEYTENGILMTFETEWIDDGFPRWLLTFGDQLEIIYPETLKDNFKNLVKRIYEKL
ncbi:YafY family protein [Soonwooa sp.]|uniref:helix-turn-helix transcriptional regulator n=1 Tax=Soonwooa sp. TaxID=1938592 RepID=UPI00262BC9DB|nr:YafY family protein [Soonwooa sp.]